VCPPLLLSGATVHYLAHSGHDRKEASTVNMPPRWSFNYWRILLVLKEGELMKKLLSALSALVFLSALTFPQLDAQDQNPEHYVRGIPQCVHYEWTKSSLNLVNTCNTTANVVFTSQGPVWGQTSVAPGGRAAIESTVIFNPRETGEIWMYPCPDQAQPVRPDGSQIGDPHYHGAYRCYTGG
jgi:hypothetical protein